MPSSDAARRLATGALWLALAALALAISVQQISSSDYWWHLRTGQLIAETRAVPMSDVYTYTAAGRRWIDVHWLFQLGLYGIHRVGGHAGAVLAQVATVLAVIGLVAPIGYRRERVALSTAALAAMLVLMGERMMPRPELATFLLLAAVLATLERFRRRGDAWVYALPGLQLVWVNMHGLYPLGLALAGFYLLAEVAHWLGSGDARSEYWPRVRRLGLAGLLAALMSFANPNGLDAVLYPFVQLQMIGSPETRGLFAAVIAELAPSLSPEGLLPLARGVFIGLATASLGAMLLNWRRLVYSDVLVLLSFLYLGLAARRNATLFAIVAAPLLVRNLNGFLDARTRSFRVPSSVAAAVALGIVILAADAVGGGLFSRLETLRRPGLGVLEIIRPVAAVDWIERVRPPGQIAHALPDGGYLIWRLFPDYRAMIDGRLEVFGERLFSRLALANGDYLRALDAKYGIGVVLLNTYDGWSDELVSWLRFNSNWRLVFVDDAALVFVKAASTPESEAPEIDIDSPDLFAPLQAEPSAIQKLRLTNRVSVYSAFGRWSHALEVWEDALERYPDWPDGETTHVYLLRRSGQRAEALRVVREALAEAPENAELHALEGEVHLEEPDLAAARASFEAALALDPGSARALMGLAWLAERSGDAATAARLYQRVVSLGKRAGPSFGKAISNLRKLRAGRPGRG